MVEEAEAAIVVSYSEVAQWGEMAMATVVVAAEEGLNELILVEGFGEGFMCDWSLTSN